MSPEAKASLLEGLKADIKLDPTRTAQTAKYPSSQEQGRKGAGVDDAHPKVNNFMTNMWGSVDRNLAAPARHPIDTASGMASSVVDMAKHPVDTVLAGGPAGYLERKTLDPAMEMASKGDYTGAAGDVAGLGLSALIGKSAGTAGETVAGALPDAAAATDIGTLGRKLHGGAISLGHKVQDVFRPPPDVTALRALGDNDPAMLTQHIPKALDEIKAWEDQTGERADTAVKQRAALSNRLTANNKEFSRIAQVQRDVKVPGSRAGSIKAQIEAIPEDIRTTKPRQYQNLVNSIQAQAELPDFTIGELDDVRQSLGTKNASYGKDASHQIAAEHSTKAIDAALENFARKAQYDAMDWNVPGTGIDGAELKSRIGAMINYDDALFKKNNKSIIESSQPKAARVVGLAGKIMSPGKTLRDFGAGRNVPIDSDLASAARRWTGRPEATEPLTAPLPPQAGPAPGSPRVPGVNPVGEPVWQLAPQQGELLPNDVGTPLFEPPPGSSSAIGQDIFRIQQRTPRYQSSVEGNPTAPRSLVGGVDEGMVAASPTGQLPTHAGLGSRSSIAGEWRPQEVGAQIETTPVEGGVAAPPGPQPGHIGLGGRSTIDSEWRTPRSASSLAGAEAGTVAPDEGFKPSVTIRDWSRTPLAGAPENTWPRPTQPGTQTNMPGALPRPENAVQAESFYPGKSGVVDELDAQGNPVTRDYTRQPHLFGLQQGQDTPPFSMKDITDRGLMGSHGANRMARIADSPFDMDFLKELEETGGIDPADAAKIRRDLSGQR
jgi:hypothetical protein